MRFIDPRDCSKNVATGRDIHVSYQGKLIIKVCTSCLHLAVFYLFRSGGVQASSLEAEYGDDIDFLLAKLRAAEGDKEVSQCEWFTCGSPGYKLFSAIWSV